jgi:hypothetical protein
VLTDVSEERIASIFRVEEKIRKSAGEEPAWAGANSHRPENLKSYNKKIYYRFDRRQKTYLHISVQNNIGSIIYSDDCLTVCFILS